MAENHFSTQVISEDRHQLMSEQFHRFYLTLSGLEKLEQDGEPVCAIDLKAVMLAFNSLYEEVTDIFQAGVEKEKS